MQHLALWLTIPAARLLHPHPTFNRQSWNLVRAVSLHVPMVQIRLFEMQLCLYPSADNVWDPYTDNFNRHSIIDYILMTYRLYFGCIRLGLTNFCALSGNENSCACHWDGTPDLFLWGFSLVLCSSPHLSLTRFMYQGAIFHYKQALSEICRVAIVRLNETPLSSPIDTQTMEAMVHLLLGLWVFVTYRTR